MTALYDHIYDSAIIKALGWTIIHSMWEGLLVAILLWIILRYTPPKSAQLRYLISCMALLVMVSMTIVTYVLLQNIPDKSILSLANQVAATSKSYSFLLTSKWIPIVQHSTVPLLPLLAIAWVIGFGFMIVKSIGGYAYIGRLKRNSVEVGGIWSEVLNNLLLKLDFKRTIELKYLMGLESPLVFGTIKSIILIPAGLLTGLNQSQIELILLHELAHIRRWDYSVRQIQNALESLLFYNPFMWWISKRINEERECSCDHWVIQYTGQDQLYIKTLYDVEVNRSMRLVNSFGSRQYSLLNRIKRIMGKKTNSGSSYKLIVAAILLLTISLVSWQRIEINGQHENAEVVNNRLPLAAIPAVSKVPKLTAVPEIVLDTLPPVEVNQIIEKAMKAQQEAMKQQESLLRSINEGEIHQLIQEQAKLQEQLMKEMNSTHMEETMKRVEKEMIQNKEKLERLKEVDMEEVLNRVEEELTQMQENLHRLDEEKFVLEEELAQVREREMEEILLRAEEEVALAQEMAQRLEEGIVKENLQLEAELEVRLNQINQFQKSLEIEMRRDGLLKDGEILESVQIENAKIKSFNGKKLPKDTEQRYSDLIRKYLGETSGKIKWNN